MMQVRRNPDDFVWKSIRTPDELEQVRMGAMREFLDDYEPGLAAGRYLAGSLPALPFPDRQFDLCLCSHFLFLYDSLGMDFHLQSMLEMVQVADEVRVYPVINTNCILAGFFDELIAQIRARGLTIPLERSGYDLWRKWENMLRVTR